MTAPVATRRPRPELDQRPAADPAVSVWVSASAGTGKTKVLTDRVLRLLLGGTLSQRILCLTFTKAAAAEMSNRIATTLGKWAVVDDAELVKLLTELTGHRPDAAAQAMARRLFARVLDAPGGLAIQTIHGFCQSLLRRFPIEADIAPHFTVMDERSAEEMLDAARAEILNRAEELDLGGPLGIIAQHLNEESFDEVLKELTAARGQLETLTREAGGVDGLAAAIHRRLNVTPGTTDRSVVTAACAESAFDGAALRSTVAALAQGSKTDKKRGTELARWLETPATRADQFDDYIKIFLTDDGDPRETLITKAAQKLDPDAESALRAEAERLLEVQEMRRAAIVAGASVALLRIGSAVLDAYRRHKQNSVLLDYADLILASRDLLRRPGVAPWVLYKLDGGIDHILIDEAQDTNPEQWEVVEALASEFFSGAGARPEVERTVFAVGDAKQSIFSFQGADPAAFERMRRHFAEKAGKAWLEVPLKTSFRSADSVLRAVDAVFANSPARDGVAGGQAIEHEAFRTGQAGQVELWPPAMPPEREVVEPWRPPVTAIVAHSPRARLARLIALKIQRWISQGERLESKGRPVRPGDIMILVRRRGPFVFEVVRALKTLGVPVAGVDRMVLTEQLAVMDLIALGEFLLLPEDDLTLATVLKGPLIGLSEDQLYQLAHERTTSLWASLQRRAHESADFSRAAEYLSQLLGRADLMPPYELYARVLGAARGREQILGRLGPEAADPLDEFLHAALLYQRQHPPSLQGFLHWLAASADDIKRDLERGARNEVRVMTVHGAKGLQAPIVFLPDTLQKPNKLPKLLWPESGGSSKEPAIMLWPPLARHCEAIARRARAAQREKQEHEHRRLLYVAMTRAEDRLYVCGWENRKSSAADCWYALIKAGLANSAATAAFDFSREFPEEFGGAHPWAGDGLKLLNPQEAEEEKEQRVSEGPDAADVAPDWLGAPPFPESVPPIPISPSRPPTDESAAEPPLAPPFAGQNAKGFRRGVILHRLLQSLPELGVERRQEAGRKFLARPVHGLTETEQAELLAEALAVLGQAEVEALFGPSSRAEAPVIGRLGTTVVAGQVDRLAVLDDRVLLVDYKSNRKPPPRSADIPAIYLRQMALYRALLARIFPGKSIECYLLWTAGPRLDRLEDAELDRHLPAEARS